MTALTGPRNSPWRNGLMGTGDPWDTKLDSGFFKYFAGPVYVNAPGRCVRYGGVVSQPKGRGNLVFFRTFYSRYVACG